MDAGSALIGVILMSMLGLAAGNFATTFIYRLPRGLKCAGDPPYCDSCHGYLEPRDLFPFLSWVVNRARCRFCGAPVPALYAVVELSCALLFNTAFFLYWPQAIDVFIVTLGIGVSIIMLAALHVAEKRLFILIAMLTAAFGAIYRVLLDHTIFGFLGTAAFGLMAGGVGWLLKMAIVRRKVPFPDFAIVLGLAGLCLAKPQWPMMLGFAITFAVLLWLLGRRNPQIRGSEGVLAVSFALLTTLL